jgi:hypothetical protein
VAPRLAVEGLLGHVGLQQQGEIHRVDPKFAS